MTVLEFSGGESARLTEALIDNGVTDLLYSYYWIQSMGRGGWIRKLKERNPQLNITLDSGAFTYSQKIGDERLPPPRLFFRRYKEYIADNLDVFGKVMEFDCDDPDVDVSSDEVADWTEELLDTFPDKRITPVFHAWRGVEEWDRYLKDPRVKSLAIGRSPPMDGLVSVYIDQAHRVGKTVHGLAWTKYNTSLPFLPFDSVDSSVAGDSMIWVRKAGKVRVLRIEDFHASTKGGCTDGYETLTSVKSGGEYVTKWMPLTRSIKHTVDKPFCDVVLDTGRTVSVTGDHSLFRMTKEGTLVEVKPEDMAVGDFLATVKCPVWSGLGVEGLSQDLLEFIGVWFADGHIGKQDGVDSMVGISGVHDQEVYDLCARVAAAYDGRLSTAPNGIDGRIHCRKLVRALRDLGCVGDSYTKAFPSWFWQLTKEQACCLLRGYYSGDGSAGRHITCNTVSRLLWQQLGEALPALLQETVSMYWKDNTGKVSGFGGPKANMGTLTITNDDTKQVFAERIGFLQKYKNEGIQYAVTPKRAAYTSYVPTSLAPGKIVRPRKNAQGWRQVVGPHVRSVDRRTAKGNFDQAVLSDDLVYLEVKEIRWHAQERRDVYDLSVAGPERFLANGVLAHNSTWVSGQKYGNFYIYRNNKILNLTLRNRGALRIRGERAYIEARGCDPDLIFKGDKWELLTCNIRTWILIAKKLEILRKKQHRVLTEEKPVKQVAAWPQPRNSSFDLESFLLTEKS